jgi:hypothetical protein
MKNPALIVFFLPNPLFSISNIAKKLGGISIDSNKTKSKNVYLFIFGAVAGSMK